MAKKKPDDDKWNAFFDFLFFYGSWLWLPALVLLIYYFRQGAFDWPWLLAGLVILAICFYGRFIEPRILKVKEHHFDLTPEGHTGQILRLKVALFSDTHYGIFKHAMPLQRLRQAAEAREVDLVVVAGDLTNHLMVHEIDPIFEEFRSFKVPVLGVLGNHDFGRPGWLVSDFLSERLKAHGVTMLDNESHTLTIKGEEVRVVGLKDHYSGAADFTLLGDDTTPEPHIVIAHNPDTVLHVPVGRSMGIMVSGHTHGGQIRLPRFYKKVIPTRFGFDAGFYLTRGHKVFVSSGTGMDVLPVRLMIPPRLDILHLIIARDPSAETD